MNHTPDQQPAVTDERRHGGMPDQVILDELHKYADFGAIDYVLPTDPIGQAWVISLRGQILKFNTGEAIAFIAGAGAVAQQVARARGLL